MGAHSERRHSAMHTQPTGTRACGGRRGDVEVEADIGVCPSDTPLRWPRGRRQLAARVLMPHVRNAWAAGAIRLTCVSERFQHASLFARSPVRQVIAVTRRPRRRGGEGLPQASVHVLGGVRCGSLPTVCRGWRRALEQQHDELRINGTLKPTPWQGSHKGFGPRRERITRPDSEITMQTSDFLPRCDDASPVEQPVPSNYIGGLWPAPQPSPIVSTSPYRLFRL